MRAQALQAMKKNLRAVAGASMLHALESARRAGAGNSARGPQRKRTSARWRGRACCARWSQPAALWRGTMHHELVRKSTAQ